MFERRHNQLRQKGFTIVELLIVIVVIAILAAIATVAYSGVSQRARISSVQVDLNGSAKLLGIDNVTNNAYPATLALANAGRGLTASNGTTYEYTYTAGTNSYCLTATNGNIAYMVTSANSAPVVGTCPGHVAPGGPVVVNGWSAIASGSDFTCGINTGKAYCWGLNGFGQLGNGTTSNSSVPVAVTTSGVLAGKNIIAITAGPLFACVLSSDSLVFCWGYNSQGMLGNGSTTNSTTPVAVTATGALLNKTVTSVGAGSLHACAIASGQAYCWGYNNSGQLGNNLTTTSNVPVAVDTSSALLGLTVTSIAGGYYHTCAIASNSQAYCWGSNSNGQLGNNSTTASNVPIAVNTAGVLSAKMLSDIAVGIRGMYSCAISADEAFCWGSNSYGQLGGSSAYPNSLIPVVVSAGAIPSSPAVTAIDTGTEHACVVAGGSAYCWGNNTSGQLGNNSTTYSGIPVAVTKSGVLAGKTVSSVMLGSAHTCALATDTNVYCWGSNASTQLGNGLVTPRSNVPVLVINP
jgi:prepilin-type N-terminal cleavage/methylation domain-containing protein